MEGLLVVLGVCALITYVVLPIITLVAVMNLGRRLESLERAVRELLRPPALQAAKARPGAPAPSVAEAPPPPSAASAAVRLEAPAAAVAAARPPPLAPASSAARAAPDQALAALLESAPPPKPKPAPAPAHAATRGADAAGARLLSRMWSWVVVGEEFRRAGVSAEFAIATTWLVRAGVLSGVLAVGFGLQLSVARGLLGPAGRVSLALLAGAGFIVLGLRCLCRRYGMLGQGLVGGGLAMFYFAFFAASMRFHLMPLSWAFLCMGAVTASSAVLALRLNALSIAIFGVLGGYATPLLLRSPSPDLPMFYAYLALLAVGIAAAAAVRQWPVLTWLSMLCNGALFLGAAGQRCGWHAGGGTGVEVAYLCAFFALFSTSQFLYAVRRREPATPVEMGALFVNALLTVGGGALLVGVGAGERVRLAALALGLCAFYVAHVWYFVLRGRFDRGLVACFIALALIFLGLALPLLLSGQVLSAVLALHAVALLWLARRLESGMLLAGAMTCYAVVLARLSGGLLGAALFARAEAATYWSGLADRAVALGVPLAALFGGWRLFMASPAPAKSGVQDAWMHAGPSFSGARAIFATAFYAGLALAATREVFAASLACAPDFRWAAVTVTWAALAAHLIASRARLADKAFAALACAAGALIFAQWLLWGWTGGIWPVADELRHAATYDAATALPRLLATVACLAALLGARRALAGGAPALGRLMFGAALAASFLYVTFEASTCSATFLPGFRRWAVSVVWACYGLSLLIGGLRCARRGLRLAGLGLFSVTVAKVFLVDLAGSDVLYRLVAFGVVGGVLLLAAYAYLRSQDTFRVSRPDGREGS